MSTNNLTFLDDSLFKHNQKVKEIFLIKNQLVEIRPGTFDPLLNLQNLDLSHNYLTVLDENLFRKNRKLKGIFLYNNQIIAISPKTFQNQKIVSWNLANNTCISSANFNSDPSYVFDQILKNSSCYKIYITLMEFDKVTQRKKSKFSQLIITAVSITKAIAIVTLIILICKKF